MHVEISPPAKEGGQKLKIISRNKISHLAVMRYKWLKTKQNKTKKRMHVTEQQTPQRSCLPFILSKIGFTQQKTLI